MSWLSGRMDQPEADLVEARRRAGGTYGERVEAYVSGRLGYPSKVVDELVRCGGVARGAAVAEVGSGTGLFTASLLDHGFVVHAIEPDVAMRAHAERLYRDDPGFVSHDASAEATGLEDASVDVVTAAQSLHWFDAERASAEFRRIARTGALLFCVWKDRRKGGTPFLEELEALLLKEVPTYRATSQSEMDMRNLTARYSRDGEVVKAVTASQQELSADGLIALVLSTSYAPEAGEPAGERLVARLRQLAERHARSGHVTIEYDVIMTSCRLG